MVLCRRADGRKAAAVASGGSFSHEYSRENRAGRSGRMRRTESGEDRNQLPFLHDVISKRAGEKVYEDVRQR